MPSGHTYSGAELRIRDKAIQEEHSKQIAAFDAKYERLQHAYDKKNDEHFTLVNYGDRVAQLLGFRFLTDVQTFIELADEQVKYKDLAKRVDELKAELAMEKRDKQAMKHDLVDVTEERDLLQVVLAEQTAKVGGPSAETLAKELVELQSRYNEVTERAARADAEIKEHMVKWRAFKQWMQNEEKKFEERKKKLNAAEKIREGHGRCLKRRQKMKEVGLDDDDKDEDNLRESIAVHGASTVFEYLVAETAEPATPIQTKISPAVPSSSTSINPTANADATAVVSSTSTHLQSVLSKQTTTNQYSSHTIVPSSPMQSKDVIDLSETDNDSQVSITLDNPAPKDDVIVIDQRPAAAATRSSLPGHSILPTRLPRFGVDNPNERRASNPFVVTPRTRTWSEDEDAGHERPRKIRRFSSPVRIPLAVTTNGGRTSENRSSPVASRGRENRMMREDAPLSTPANTSARKQLTDYSAFKGRGRYGKAAAAGNDTINASYAIDPARNGGVDFQYDAVVRRKEDRRRMDGGDCECCRDYYEAIGPMPDRLQPPLWRSPQKSSSERKPCRNGGREDAIYSHKQAISRHRHDWAQGSTPPSYWDIGFPSTQEAQLINQKAAEMQQKKRRMVEREAENGGRYYKTR
ncbi:DNA repair protein endonuclease SAE2/CtIP C-terminus-domain-containing protein [Mycena sanguinolenta]|nr:DNA repair protein endonuclease SAE2/CtIP C-terminus-domain-containing protein [Mycena sanguinolenta]